MQKTRLDQAMANRGIVRSRSQAESYIKLGKVKVNNNLVTKPGTFVDQHSVIQLEQQEQYVSRAALKLASVTGNFGLDFEKNVVLDVGSSTGGFTDYALRRGASKVIAVDVGTDQLHPSLRADERIELHEKTDIRDLKLDITPDIILIDVSFISLRQVLPSIVAMAGKNTLIMAMLKPQFEATQKEVNKGVIKNDTIRRQILKDFELWTKNMFIVIAKADSGVSGAKGNRERFYLLKSA